MLLYGGGDFAFSAVKEISVTEEFLQLREDQRKCVDYKTREKCRSTLFRKEGIAKCGCELLKLGPFPSSSKVMVMVKPCLIYIS